MRLSLFLRSYGAYTILNRFKDKPNYRIVSRLGNILNLDIRLLNKFFSSGTYPRGLPNLNRLTKYLVPKEKMLIYLEIEYEIINLILEKQDKEKTSLEDYDKAIMEPAIERVAGNHLKNIEDGTILRPTNTNYQHPVSSLLLRSKNLFILRLIQN